MKKASASEEARVSRPRPIRPRFMPVSTFCWNQALEVGMRTDLAQNGVGARLARAQNASRGPFDGGFLLGRHDEGVEPVV